MAVRALYYFVLFFAYWFGARRFDVDGDGDFDAADVQAYIDGHLNLSDGFSRKKRVPKARPKAKTTRKSARPQPQPLDDVDGQGAPSIFDRDGDGDVDFNDAIYSTTEGTAQEDVWARKVLRGQFVPLFVVTECVACFGLWLGFAIKIASETGADPLVQMAGLDSFKKGLFDLRVFSADCQDLRQQAWRWWSYQFTHIGVGHVLTNSVMNVCLGIPLEGAHGPLRMLLMYNIGVFGGACSYFVLDSHTTVVGCSGGCYALIGIHLADLAMNWAQKKFRLPTLVFILLLAGFDLVSFSLSVSSGQVSHAVHAGGFVFGMLCGCLLVVNLKRTRCEQIAVCIVAVVMLALTASCLAWLFLQEGGPRSMEEHLRGTPGWCWLRQVYSPELDPTSWLCVRCGVGECIARFTAPGYEARLTDRAVCEARGFFYEGR